MHAAAPRAEDRPLVRGGRQASRLQRRLWPQLARSDEQGEGPPSTRSRRSAMANAMWGSRRESVALRGAEPEPRQSTSGAVEGNRTVDPSLFSAELTLAIRPQADTTPSGYNLKAVC